MAEHADAVRRRAQWTDQLVAPLVAIYPLVTVILSAIMLRHIAITARLVLGTVLTVAGVALVLAG
jgi:uncharacterized membrane protein